MKYTFSLFIITLLAFSASAQLPAPFWKINTIAGKGIQGFNGDGAVATDAELNGPIAVGRDSAGNMYILDYFNRRIRKVDIATNNISTVAGNGTWGNTGDGSLGTSATISPRGMAVDKKGNVYIADESYSVIRKVTAATGIITRYAGNGTFGYSGDGGQALSAQFRSPYGLCLDAAGNLFIADAGNHVIRKITAATGIITTVAGNDTAGYSGDFGLAIHARIDSPYAVAVDRIGNLYFSDHRNNVVRKVDTAGIITTYAGTYNVYSHTGDGGLAILATLNGPKGLVLDTLGNMYICDADNHVIRKVDTFKMISTWVATGFQGFGGDLGMAIGANLNNPHDIAIDKWGALYIADANNHRIRKVYNATLAVNTVSNNDIRVYPNPVSNNIMVSGLVQSDKVSVFDMMGRMVTDTREVTSNVVQELKLGNLATGTYILVVTDNAGNNKATVQMVKQ